MNNKKMIGKHFENNAYFKVFSLQLGNQIRVARFENTRDSGSKITWGDK